MTSDWFYVSNVEEVPSPALLLYPERIEENIRRMVSMAGGVARLRPHIKTHKLPEIVRMQMADGITKFKCATIAEAEMAAIAAAGDILLAYQPVGPNIKRVAELARRFPQSKFGVLVDDPSVVTALSRELQRAQAELSVFVDVDCGMHRTGIAPSEKAVALYASLKQPGLIPGGLHAYDGHIHDSDPAARARRCEEAFAPVSEFRAACVKAGQDVPTIVAGGTPTFPLHARRHGVDCSPGTCLLWDAGYSTKLPDLDFLCAAVVLTRVISKPGTNRLCLDLGHKSVASENPHPRVQFPQLADAKAVTHSEEHLVIETTAAAQFAVGDALYGISWHICPTVALHSEAVVIRNHSASSRWRIIARERVLSI
jgi:D-serine deaminase-like pyridoxal phosphate-dependent protein